MKCNGSMITDFHFKLSYKETEIHQLLLTRNYRIKSNIQNRTICKWDENGIM